MVEHLVPPDPGSDVVLVGYDDRWPALYLAQERRIRAALGDVAVAVHHVGSTSVPGLAAKPVVDVVIEVPDAADETSYADALVGVGYAFALREPEWFGHRLFKDRDPRVNVHVFGRGCPEVARMLAFRDHLREVDDDRSLYEATKRELAARDWSRVQDYADAKTDVIETVLGRARPGQRERDPTVRREGP